MGLSTDKLVSIVIITRHRPAMIGECLQHLGKEKDDRVEICVVDNSDPENTETETMVKNMPWVRYIRVGPCENFQTHTRNIGIENSSGEIIAFLDDDSMVYPGWLDACRNGYADEGVGAVGGMILDPEVEHLDHSRHAEILKVLPNGGITDNCDCDPGRMISVDQFRGCNYSVLRKAIESAGCFDDFLMGYGYQDLDVLTRIRECGFELIYNPPMKIYHKLFPRETDQRSSIDYKKHYGLYRNLSYIVAKNYGIFSGRWFRFLFSYKTNIIAVLKKPSSAHWTLFFAGIHGKLSGMFHYIKHRNILIKTGKLPRINRKQKVATP